MSGLEGWEKPHRFGEALGGGQGLGRIRFKPYISV
jgi:hypothetical protein